MGSEKRIKQLRIDVRVSQEEFDAITKNASGHSLTRPEFLRRLGMGVEVKSTIDSQHILALSKINGDIGRLGGLLKFWLSEDFKTANSHDVGRLVSELRELKQALEERVMKL